MNVEAGDLALPFTLPDQNGDPVSLEDFRGQTVLLYFYPKDDTPGCTTQACGIRDLWGEFEDAGAAVVGISPDDVASHDRFRAKYDLPQTLLADPDHRVMEQYGAWGEKVLYGKRTIGVIRSSVLIGPDGIVVKVWKRAQAKAHPEQALKALRALT